MNIYDVSNTIVQSKSPDDVVVILQEPFQMHGMVVNKIELRLYQTNRYNRPYHVIVAYLEMDGHIVQMTYDEGPRGDDPLRRAADFLMSHLGISALVLRARILVDTHADD